MFNLRSGILNRNKRKVFMFDKLPLVKNHIENNFLPQELYLSHLLHPVTILDLPAEIPFEIMRLRVSFPI
jgi:hypothetical protein